MIYPNTLGINSINARILHNIGVSSYLNHATASGIIHPLIHGVKIFRGRRAVSYEGRSIPFGGKKFDCDFHDTYESDLWRIIQLFVADQLRALGFWYEHHDEIGFDITTNNALLNEGFHDAIRRRGFLYSATLDSRLISDWNENMRRGLFDELIRTYPDAKLYLFDYGTWRLPKLPH